MSAFYKITKSRGRERGLIVFRLAIWENGQEVWSIGVNSGQPGVQNLRTYEDTKSVPGNYEPIPEGKYQVKPSIAWASGIPNDWDTYWNAGLGPFLIDLVAPKEGQFGFRGLFRIHLDGNRSYAPGSAGCPVAVCLEDAKDIVEAFEKYKPTYLIVDYGLGTFSKTSENKPESKYCTVTIKGDPHFKGECELKDGKSYPTMPTLCKLLGYNFVWQKDKNNIELYK